MKLEKDDIQILKLEFGEIMANEIVSALEIKQRLENEIRNTKNYYSDNIPQSIRHHIEQCELILTGVKIF